MCPPGGLGTSEHTSLRQPVLGTLRTAGRVMPQIAAAGGASVRDLERVAELARKGNASAFVAGERDTAEAELLLAAAQSTNAVAWLERRKAA